MNYSLPSETALVDDAQKVMIALHGYGADGRDLISLAEPVQQLFPHVSVISPHAPEPCGQNPTGRQWFALDEFSLPAMQAGVERAMPSLLQYLASVTAEHQIAYHDLVLLGFSQGTMMALQCALALEETPCAVVGFSGLLAHNNPSFRTQTPCPIHLVHGEQDTVIPIAGSVDAHQRLQQLGFPTSLTRCRNLDHGINPEGLSSALHFLRQHL